MGSGITCERVKIDRQGYTSFGRYFGPVNTRDRHNLATAPVFLCEDKDAGISEYVRGFDAADAKRRFAHTLARSPVLPSLWQRSTPTLVSLRRRYATWPHFVEALDEYADIVIPDTVPVQYVATGWIQMPPPRAQSAAAMKREEVHAAKMVDALLRGDDMPPVLLNGDGTIHDGRARVIAALRTGLPSVPAVNIDPFRKQEVSAQRAPNPGFRKGDRVRFWGRSVFYSDGPVIERVGTVVRVAKDGMVTVETLDEEEGAEAHYQRSPGNLQMVSDPSRHENPLRIPRKDFRVLQRQSAKDCGAIRRVKVETAEDVKRAREHARSIRDQVAAATRAEVEEARAQRDHARARQAGACDIARRDVIEARGDKQPRVTPSERARERMQKRDAEIVAQFGSIPGAIELYRRRGGGITFGGRNGVEKFEHVLHETANVAQFARNSDDFDERDFEREQEAWYARHAQP